jgi:hypothetical protein
MTVTPTCNAQTDGLSVTGFGDLGNSPITGNPYLAATCTWRVAHTGYLKAVESDIRFNKVDHSWVVTLDGSCQLSPRYHLESVATHERGHTAGMDHPDGHDAEAEALHPNLTMSPFINGTCQSSESTLGYGDVINMRDLYRP